ncbi:MAG TPA: prepilin-type N-terminal cleavage/methylation domain-containing protein [Casimicrobiaceae bacterium]|nr:prepilin-type N-terminal cleavage/methylation domain-containing protein [Casimicrobiaceae bacterium]
MSAARLHQRGFTLLELVIALVLFALMSSVMYGALGFAGRSRDAGEAHTEAAASMRLSHAFLRAQLEGQHPLRMRKMLEYPLLFTGASDELRYAAQLPARITGGGVWYYRLAVVREGEKSRLVLERRVPDTEASELPEFDKADRSILAEDIGEIRIGYFGRDAGAAPATAPTWRERWDDRNRLPLLVRIDVVPQRGPAWPTLLVASRQAQESGCRQWDASTERCVGMS